MIQLPPVINTVFQNVPVKLYPGQSTVVNHSGRKFRLVKINGGKSTPGDGSSDSPGNDEACSLAVYGIFKPELDLSPASAVFNSTNGWLATDPLCLFAQLYLCHKNGFVVREELEAEEADAGEEAKEAKEAGRAQLENSILVISYRGSQDCQLPLLIESKSSQQNTLRRSVRSSSTLSSLIMSQITDNKLFLVINLIDRVFNDVWIFTVIAELKPSQVAYLYSPESPFTAADYYKFSEISGFKNLVLKDLIANLIKRHEFNKRYPVICENIHSYMPNFVTIKGKPAKLEAEIEFIFSEFREFLGGVQKLDQGILDDDIFKMKMASYVELMRNFCRETRAWRIFMRVVGDEE